MIEDKIQADEALEQLKQLQAKIQDVETERDEFISYYNGKIEAAQKICDDKTKDIRIEVELLKEQLRQFALANLPDNRRSITLPTATLQFRKQSPAFFFDDLKPATAQNEQLIHFVKHNAHDYLKVKVDESVDWAKFKAKLAVSDDGRDVSFIDTGEIIEGLHAQFLPDKFEVKL